MLVKLRNCAFYKNPTKCHIGINVHYLRMIKFKQTIKKPLNTLIVYGTLDILNRGVRKYIEFNVIESKLDPGFTKKSYKLNKLGRSRLKLLKNKYKRT